MEVTTQDFSSVSMIHIAVFEALRRGIESGSVAGKFKFIVAFGDASHLDWRAEVPLLLPFPFLFPLPHFSSSIVKLVYVCRSDRRGKRGTTRGARGGIQGQ